MGRKVVGEAVVGGGVGEAVVGGGVVGVVCRACKRDPKVMPPDFMVRRGRRRPGTLEEWVAKVRVVAFGLCARDYQRARRGTRVVGERRTGVEVKKTIRLLPAEGVIVDEACAKSGLSESAWGARAMVETAERELGKSLTTK